MAKRIAVKKMLYPQSDMRTWKETKPKKPKSSGIRLTPRQRKNIREKRTFLV